MSTIPSPGGDQNQAAKLLAFTWILCTIAFLFTLLRAYARFFITRNIWWDDWLAFLTMASTPLHRTTLKTLLKGRIVVEQRACQW